MQSVPTQEREFQKQISHLAHIVIGVICIGLVVAIGTTMLSLWSTVTGELTTLLSGGPDAG